MLRGHGVRCRSEGWDAPVHDCKCWLPVCLPLPIMAISREVDTSKSTPIELTMRERSVKSRCGMPTGGPWGSRQHGTHARFFTAVI